METRKGTDTWCSTAITVWEAALNIYDEALAAAQAREDQDVFTSPVRVLAFIISGREPIGKEASQEVKYEVPKGRTTKR